MVQLAAEYGISDSGLKKICQRLHVPSPPPGWWNKKAAGKSVRIAPLPPAKPGTPLQVIISRTLQRERSLQDAVDALAGLLGEIPVPERLARPHPVIANWISEHRERQEHAREYRRIWPDAKYDVPDFTAVERRRHRILHALFRALERRGAVVSQDDRRHLIAKIRCETIEFSCHQKSRQVMRPLTADEKRLRTSNTNGLIKALEPTGFLDFQIRTWVERPFRKRWLENDKQQLDGMLPEIAASFLVLADVLTERSRRREQDARAWAERQRELNLEREHKQQDENRWKRFLEMAADWKRVAVARELIAQLRELQVGDTDPIDGRRLGEWLDWAEAKASECDPLGKGVDHLFAEVAKVGP